MAPAPAKDEEKKAVELTAETDSKKKKEEDGKKAKKKTDDDVPLNTMSPEDLELKERLETCVSIVVQQKVGGEEGEENVEQPPATIPVRLKALEVIVTEVRTATSSMTSVPKPLKFLRPYYPLLRKVYKQLQDSTSPTSETLLFQARLADVLSVLAMTLGKKDDRESLAFKLAATKVYDSLETGDSAKKEALLKEAGVDLQDNLGCWGHEYVRNLAGEIGREYDARVVDGADPQSSFEDLMSMVDVIVPFHLSHNAEAEAVDLLIEVQRLSKLLGLAKDGIDEKNFHRICLYLLKTADYMSEPDDLAEVLETAYQIYVQQAQYFDALRVALRMNKTEAIGELIGMASSDAVKKQMCLLLGRHRVNYTMEDDDTLNELIGNVQLSEQFIKLAQDLDVVDAKTPEDIYKSHLAETGGFTRQRRDASGAVVDSARANLASTFVNAFVNAGYGQDKLMTPDNEWLYKNKDHGVMSAAASLGMILLWNVEEGLTQIDKFLYSSDEYIKAGAALAVGILTSGVRNEADPALALLTEHVEGNVHLMKCAAVTALGIAYAGSGREDVQEVLLPIVESSGGAETMLEVSLAGLALGMVFCGQCDESAGSTIVQRLMEATEEELDHSHAKFLCLGLGLLFLGRMEKADAMLEALRTVEHKISKYAVLTLETCAYAGTGNVLKVQEMLHQCTEHLTEDANHQMAAVVGIGLITMGEDVGSEMALRTFDHLLHYCELPIKRAVPLALAILHISNPDFSVMDQLSRLSHDPDPALSQNAILAMGLAGAGTNNSRVAGLLRQLSEFYHKDASHVFCVRIAQGLLHMGKGLLSLQPFHSDRLLLCGPALAGILVLIHAALDLKASLLDKTHYLLYYLTCAMNPRMLVTSTAALVDEWKPVTVRVGQAVETVGQAGRPKTITGFQTHTTPVLIGTRERAELATDEYVAVASVLEGIVLVEENLDAEKNKEEEEEQKEGGGEAK